MEQMNLKLDDLMIWIKSQENNFKIAFFYNIGSHSLCV